ncbi:PAS domain-containing protein [Staphylococcus simulans]|uniref:PAS domain-containing protein n=1 Tax=Staphylococcus simulans TaxID=1286 RepID=UPI000D1E0062|nr:PAS domain-containing protein [Staphylococcus simulans]MDY5060060.1 PAS domain-containing protein [Staphylococcus simulans]PTJ16010.1 PAS domain S-box protein [Staphylococcus simulans]
MFNISSVSNEVKEEVKGLIDQHIHQEDITDMLIEFSQNVSSSKITEALRQLYFIEKFTSMLEIERFVSTYEKVTKQSLTEITLSNDKTHPLNIFQQEISVFKSLLQETAALLGKVEESEIEAVELFKEKVQAISGLIPHFNRKEKIIFPVIERRGEYILPRKMWADDDVIRFALNKLQKRVAKLEEVEWRHIQNAYTELESSLTDMLRQEEILFIPLMQEDISAVEWQQIAQESSAFGYAIEINETWQDSEIESTSIDVQYDAKQGQQNLRFGGGFLTTKEADLILNNLPVEITFVDKNGTFKYFNDLVEASDMMFIRTPISIGRNVANCHPPKSLSKVMQIIRDLKTKQKDSESMWFKKGNQFIYVTYKALFDESGEYIGILEYVQDIQPFFDLPQKFKRDATKQ